MTSEELDRLNDDDFGYYEEFYDRENDDLKEPNDCEVIRKAVEGENLQNDSY